MGMQLIFVMETDSECKTDWIYIKETIEKVYQYNNAQIKLSPVYMAGRGNYKKKERRIKELISQYAATSKTNQSKVIYCFDCDEYDRDPNDRNFLNEVKQYCLDQGSEFVWFCRDIESVYVGRKIDRNAKRQTAASFKARKMINNVDSKSLGYTSFHDNTSNILNVLDRYLQRKE